MKTMLATLEDRPIFEGNILYSKTHGKLKACHPWTLEFPLRMEILDKKSDTYWATGTHYRGEQVLFWSLNDIPTTPIGNEATATGLGHVCVSRAGEVKVRPYTKSLCSMCFPRSKSFNIELKMLNQVALPAPRYQSDSVWIVHRGKDGLFGVCASKEDAEAFIKYMGLNTLASYPSVTQMAVVTMNPENEAAPLKEAPKV